MVSDLNGLVDCVAFHNHIVAIGDYGFSSIGEFFPTEENIQHKRYEMVKIKPDPSLWGNAPHWKRDPAKYTPDFEWVDKTAKFIERDIHRRVMFHLDLIERKKRLLELLVAECFYYKLRYAKYTIT